MLVRDIEVVSSNDHSPSAPIVLYKAKPIRVEEDHPILERAVKLDALCTEDRDFYLLSGEEVSKLSPHSSDDAINASFHHQQSDSLTLSEDSDTTRIYDLSSRETKILRHDIIKKSRNPVGESSTGTPPTSPVELFHISPSTGLDKTIQQLTHKILGSSKDVRKTSVSPKKLKPNVFTQADEELKYDREGPKRQTVLTGAKKMADVELASQLLIEAERGQSVAEKSAQNVSNANSNVTIETNGIATTNGNTVERSESTVSTSAEVVGFKEIIDSEQRAVTQETSTSETVERNETATVSTAEHSILSETAQVSTAEQIHRSETVEVVSSTQCDVERNVTRTVTVTSSLIGVKQSILSETMELVSSTEEEVQHTIDGTAGFKFAIENDNEQKVVASPEPEPERSVDQHAQVISETLKSTVTDTGKSNSDANLVRQLSQPIEQHDVVVVSFTKFIFLLELSKVFLFTILDGP